MSFVHRSDNYAGPQHHDMDAEYFQLTANELLQYGSAADVDSSSHSQPAYILPRITFNSVQDDIALTGSGIYDHCSTVAEDATSTIELEAGLLSSANDVYDHSVGEAPAFELQQFAIIHATDCVEEHGLSLEAKKVLCRWYWDHRWDPYPREALPGLLEQVRMEDGNATAKQVDNWFNNVRQRGHKKCCSGVPPNTDVSNVFQRLSSNRAGMPFFGTSDMILEVPYEAAGPSCTSSNASWQTALEVQPQTIPENRRKQGRKKYSPYHSPSASRDSKDSQGKLEFHGNNSATRSSTEDIFVDAPEDPNLVLDIWPPNPLDFFPLDSTTGINGVPYDSPGYSRSPTHDITNLSQGIDQDSRVTVYPADQSAFSPAGFPPMTMNPGEMQAAEPALEPASQFSPDRNSKMHEGVPTGAANFECTFPRCIQGVSEKTWKRHEETHVPQKEHICMPNASPFVEGDTACVFCGWNYDTHSERCLLKHQKCLKRSRVKRTFDRKDKLVQHIKNFHGAAVSDAVLKAWEFPHPVNSSLLFPCGFCDKKNMSWDDRASHIARHFRDGLNVSLWQSSDPLNGGHPQGPSF